MCYKDKLYFFARDSNSVENLYAFDGTSVSIVEEKLSPFYYRTYGRHEEGKYIKPIIYNDKLGI